MKSTILAFILFPQAVQGVWDSSSSEEPRGTSQHGIASWEFASAMAAALEGLLLAFERKGKS